MHGSQHSRRLPRDADAVALGGVGFGKIHRAVGGAIIHDNGFPVRKGLSDQRLGSLREGSPGIAGRRGSRNLHEKAGIPRGNAGIEK